MVGSLQLSENIGFRIGILLGAFWKTAMAAKEQTLANVGLGFRVHSGWAAAVAVIGPTSSPSVVDRRRIELADRSIKASSQPFHSASELSLAAAEQLIKELADSSNVLAVQSFQQLTSYLSKKGYQACGSCVLTASGRPLGTLESILSSHAMIHTAEGEFFREAIRRASQACGLPVTNIREREILSVGGVELGLSPHKINHQLLELGRSIGPPWRQDEKLASLAGWLLLGRVS